jgi:hypothetical protein
VGTFDGVKRRFGLITHRRAFPTSLPPRVARRIRWVLQFSHKRRAAQIAQKS